MTVYFHEHINLVRSLHQKLLNQTASQLSLGGFLKAYANNLESGFNQKNRAVYTDISNYYKPLMRKEMTEVFQLDLSDKVFLDIAASVHGFESFDSVEEKDELLDNDFLSIVDCMLRGEKEELDKRLSNNPNVVNQHSQFGHRAQLIHYCASNAVEIYRQVIPYNLLEIIQLLLHHGADIKSKIPVYGGQFDFMELFSTSAHPRASGVDKEVYEWFDSNDN